MEDHELGTTPDTRWISFSMAKSISSTLVGAALKQGLIASIDDPVTKYVPGLKGGVYDAVSVRNLLQMASGVKWDETYTDPRSDRRKLLEEQLAGKPGTIVEYMKKLPRAGAPGTIWNYSTGESFLVGALIEGATHKPLAKYLSETLWSRLGMEQDATWWLESPGGMGLAGRGLGATLRILGGLGNSYSRVARSTGRVLFRTDGLRRRAKRMCSAASLSTTVICGGLFPREIRFTKGHFRRGAFLGSTCISLRTRSW